MTDGQRRAEFTLSMLATPFEERVKAFEISTPIIRNFGTWAVTPYGVECLIYPYPIPFSDIGEEGIGASEWHASMADKWWVAIIEFTVAMRYARRLVAKRGRSEAKTGKLSRRFRVFKRDGYRCQMCGRDSASGAKLEVDHKSPRSRGGSNDLSNLWTLCFDCNRGKGAKLLVGGGQP